ncbi:putative nucleotidyltransferase [Algoriphagus boseongensis]|uniref:Putative nucleotidyltransferase n=1 Tax=Algoriphagus boseongensis TaxID=1442587 RepID=A0A4R6T6R5_9BACT|nr:nucleotidyltransferase domain-containing protein [Algoriphagus boseongensis]TDQ18301.1 putative nucleotidyltransferase [Algoriphagus boseongensis]
MIRFGLTDKVIKSLNRVFQLHPNVERVIIYGSRAKGNFLPNSDIDLVIQGENVNFSELLEIENELDELLLPYQIDLSLFHFLSSSKDLLGHIERVGKTFFKKNSLKIEA